MEREKFYLQMEGQGQTDYEEYLKTDSLLGLQKKFSDLCNQDELLFQIVHQVEELWMKAIAYTLLDIDDYMTVRNTNRILTSFERVFRLQHLMIEQMGALETMSPKDYQNIRLQLGNGSGQESPGFSCLLKMPFHLWDSFKKHYLGERTIEQIYNSEYKHCDAYMVAEALAEFDSLFQKFRYHHMQLIQRSIGIESKSLKGRSISLLEKGVKARFFPELWEIRSTMTNEWGGSYGVKRESITNKEPSCPFSHT